MKMDKKKREIKYGSIMERLLSEENIFLAIYLVDSYIEGKEKRGLLSLEDQQVLLKRHDIFNVNYIKNEIIRKVYNRLKNIFDNDDYFEINVYFKPKKYKNNKAEFRPLHTASLIDQIAMVSMLLVLVYDIDSYGKLVLSDLSRLLPSEFFGNKIACNARELFKPWHDQYSEYSSKANELLNTYCETLEFKYEVSLDIENFFPSIDPKVLYSFIIAQFPLKLNDNDRKTLEVIVKKLLFFRLKELNEVEARWYLRSEKDEINIEKCKFAKGLPQGLPHSYFMANIFMLIVKNIYSKIFNGKMLFYVDDSVIFTNGIDNKLDNNIFEECIIKINNEIRKEETFYRNEFSVKNLPKGYIYEDNDFGVRVHSSKEESSKSAFSELNFAKENSGDKYLRGLSRETSKIGFDINTAFSDEEIRMMKSRTKAVCDLLKKELNRIEKEEHNDTDNVNKEKFKVYKEKLLRYKKYFSYRDMILSYFLKGDTKKIIDDLIKDISVEGANERSLENIFTNFKDDILFARFDFVFKNCEEEAINTDKLIKAIKKLNEKIYGVNNNHSYISKIYLEKCDREFRHNHSQEDSDQSKYSRIQPVDCYESLKLKISQKCRAIIKQVQEIKYKKFDEYLKLFREKNSRLYDCRQVFEFFDIKDVYYYGLFIISNTDELERMFLNCLYSILFCYEVDDKFILAKKSREPIEYSEIRILSALRNKNFKIEEFMSDYEHFIDDQFRCTADYLLLQVLDVFRIFVSDSKLIDQLIQIHKYCCDTWKNGSKYLHFYTLHNQEHAVCLIRTAVKIVHGISYFQMKRLDYFILFAACYLHDISMVTLPEMSSFYNDNNVESDSIYSDFVNELDEKKSNKQLMKKHLCDYYQKIDSYFEKVIRNAHAQKSAMEIRKHSELDFIDTPLREAIAQVSEAHGYDVDGIYYSKSSGGKTLINIKMIRILLRLSDLLDMSRYRISNIILNHNLENLSEESRFHWISHLITDGYDMYTFYEPMDNNYGVNKTSSSYLRKGNIKERFEIVVNVLMSQTSKVNKEKGCDFIKKSELKSESRMPEITITCQKNSRCKNYKNKCNFLCKWFTKKNSYIFEEFATLSDYLNRQKDYFFASEVSIRIKAITNTEISENVFDYLRDYVNKC